MESPVNPLSIDLIFMRFPDFTSKIFKEQDIRFHTIPYSKFIARFARLHVNNEYRCLSAQRSVCLCGTTTTCHGEWRGWVLRSWVGQWFFFFGGTWWVAFFSKTSAANVGIRLTNIKANRIFHHNRIVYCCLLSILFALCVTHQMWFLKAFYWIKTERLKDGDGMIVSVADDDCVVGIVLWEGPICTSICWFL